MFGSTVLDVVIGLLLVYLLLSVAVSAFNEVAEGLLRRRSKYLRATIERVAGTDLADEIYQTSWVQSLSDYTHSLRTQRLRNLAVTGGKKPFGNKYPSYIPSEIFVEALREVLGNLTKQTEHALDELQADGDLDEIIELLPPRVQAMLPATQLTATQLRSEIERVHQQAADDIIALFPQSALEDLDGEAVKLRQWFEHTMDRMSGWYSRQTKWLLFVWGVLFALVLNVDTFNVAGTLWTDDVTRAAAVSAAEAVVEGGDETDCVPADDDPFSCVDQAVAKVNEAEDLGIPMGWPDWPWNWDNQTVDVDGQTIDGQTIGDDSRIPQDAGAWVFRLFGIAVTGAAIAMGAPFWFDLLNKFVNFRASGPKPKRTVSEAQNS